MWGEPPCNRLPVYVAITATYSTEMPFCFWLHCSHCRLWLNSLHFPIKFIIHLNYNSVPLVSSFALLLLTKNPLMATFLLQNCFKCFYPMTIQQTFLFIPKLLSTGTSSTVDNARYISHEMHVFLNLEAVPGRWHHLGHRHTSTSLPRTGQTAFPWRKYWSPG